MAGIQMEMRDSILGWDCLGLIHFESLKRMILLSSGSHCVGWWCFLKRKKPLQLVFLNYPNLKNTQTYILTMLRLHLCGRKAVFHAYQSLISKKLCPVPSLHTNIILLNCVLSTSATAFQTLCDNSFVMNTNTTDEINSLTTILRFYNSC